MRSIASSIACLLVLALPGCPAPVTGGQTVSCSGEDRVTLDCTSEVSYQGASGEAGVKVLNIAEAQGKFEEKAIRRVGDQVEQFVAAHTRACRDYNACVMSAEQYQAEASEARRRLQVLPVLTEALKSAKTDDERAKALDALYRGVVPDEKRVEEVTFRMGMVADIPENLGGGSVSVAPGGSLPTGAKVFFKVDASKEAYVYIFQVTPTKGVNVLFPDPRIGTSNPLPGGTATRIPGEKRFKLDDKDIGTEKVYVVVSTQPVSNLDAALDKVKSGQVTTLSQDQTLMQVAMVQAPTRLGSSGSGGTKCRALALEGDESPGACTRPRALMLDRDDGGGGGGSRVSDMGGGVPAEMAVRTSAGDDRIVTVFPFEHVTEAQYTSAGGAKAPGSKTRGVVIED